MVKRIFDIVFSSIGIFLLFPVFIVAAILISLESKGGIFYKQKRVGKNNSDFYLYKFRSMYKDAEKKGLLTVGNNDSRITKTGQIIRKYKIDELPQLINVLFGSMSFVGPRPEVRKYVELYDEEQKKVLSIKPGITDYASIRYLNENELLSKSNNPEKTYIDEILPFKLKMNLNYINNRNFFTDIKIILITIFKIVKQYW